MDTLWADVSEWQPAVNDFYPHPVLAVRVCDGTYKDKKFPANHSWARTALGTGKLSILIVYCVYRPNWEQTLAATKAAVGTPHPRMVAMIDVESWGGQITGDNSDGINRLYWGLADWLGNPKRVIGYGNTGDLTRLWPTKPPGVRLVIAAYGSNPDYPGKLAHQFADDHHTDPFGPCDGNVAYGMDIGALCAALGIDGPIVSPAPSPSPVPSIPPMEYGQTSAAIMRLQAWLNATFPAYSQLPVTGFYGTQTTAVIAEFQRRVGITGADGRNVGKQTAAALVTYGYCG